MADQYPPTYNNIMRTVGSGTSIIPAFIEPSLRRALELKAQWLRFLTPGRTEPDMIFRGGIGKTITMTYSGNLAVTAGALSSGTRISTGTTAYSQATATIAEMGIGLAAEGFQEWLTNPAFNPPSNPNSFQIMDIVASLTDWSVRSLDYLVGQEVLGATDYINIDGTAAGDVSSGTASGTTGGLLTIANVNAASSLLRRKGIMPRGDCDMKFAWVGAPGFADSLKAVDAVRRDKASLGDSMLDKMGYIGDFAGFRFFEMEGPDTGLSLAASGTIGTSMIIAENAVVGDSTIGKAASPSQAGFLTYYLDWGQDSARTQMIQAYYKYAVTRTATGTDWGRVWKVRSLHA